MLVRNSNLKGSMIKLRKSQVKFESSDLNLDVIRTSSYS